MHADLSMYRALRHLCFYRSEYFREQVLRPAYAHDPQVPLMHHADKGYRLLRHYIPFGRRHG